MFHVRLMQLAVGITVLMFAVAIVRTCTDTLVGIVSGGTGQVASQPLK